ncbi:hypothetical protein ROLI_033520 [Roseobacter fucihabitans]|uniref:Uncharacterized protein n=1 Tax=Roseobacter fucihabitans TaxID=1537242 RepID=A0ABZ2BW40_9RHOB|nr:hypothetical protein [Roseobacter litoralis]MBC6966770.1 hypothetical protein [Roseobacter litoralis]
MTTRIYSVDAIDLTLKKRNPHSLLISCTGRVTSSGWSDIHLSPFVYVAPPADGILDCDLVGTAPGPGEIVIPVLTKVAAHLVVDDVDNYWGKDQPVEGVRVHASQNTKVATLEDIATGMTAARILDATDGPIPSAPSYEADIKPLFRVRDAVVMKNISGFDLHAYEDVVTWADRILETLEAKRMPCDGAWPAQDVSLFKAWIDTGKAA